MVLTNRRKSSAVAAVVAVVMALAIWIFGAGDPEKEEAIVRDVCKGLQQVELPGPDACTHGGDEIPDPNPGSMAAPALDAISPAHCAVGDEPRIEVFSARPEDRPAAIKATKRRRLARAAVDLADNEFARSTGGYRFKWHCNAEGRVAVKLLVLPPVGTDNRFGWSDFVDGMKAKGFTNGARSYLVFYDDGHDPYKNLPATFGPNGQGSLYVHDVADPSQNLNNADLPKYAIVDAWGWANWAATGGGEKTYDVKLLAHVAIHETLHNLGAVQTSAPHSLSLHCSDEWDVMCYGSPTQMKTPCPHGDDNNVDCGHDDYFYPGTPSPSTVYLAKHWNVANSRWLTPPNRP